MTCDPWIILNQLAQEGLRSVTVMVRLDGKEVALSDRHLLWTLKGEHGVPPEEKEGMRAAHAIVNLTPEEIKDVGMKAFEGDEASQRAYQALVLLELVKHKENARGLVAALEKKDSKAIHIARIIRQQATTAGQAGAKARISIYLIRDIMQEMAEAKAAEKPVAADDQPPIATEASANG